MEVAIGTNSAPFQREVREWQRVDPNTGALLRGRLEADRWISGSRNSYGKVVDSQNVSTPNGIQHSQRKQLEVLQARTSSGSLQVVRAHTVQTSSSRWSSSTTTTSTQNGTCETNGGVTTTTTSRKGAAAALQYFNGNSSAPNHHNGFTNNTAAPNLHGNNFKKRFQQESLSSSLSSSSQHSYENERIEPHRVEQRKFLLPTENSNAKSSVGGVHNTQLDLNERETFVNNSHSKLNRGKSVSNEDLTAERDEQNFDDDVEPIEWRRVSKIRRSLQYPKTSSPRNSFSRPPDLPENSVSVLKIKQELENGRRLSTAMRNNHIDLVALDNILNGVSTNETKQSDTITTPKTTKKATFLTAESLKEIRGKLRRLSDESLYKDDMSSKDDTSSNQSGSLRDEPMVNTLKITEPPRVHEEPEKITTETNYTASTTSTRSKMKNLSVNSDWYLRRKSYGFEKMTPAQVESASTSKMLESTDSGIGRSGELANMWSPTDTTNPNKGTVVALTNNNNINDTNHKSNSSAMCITLSNGSHDIKQNQVFTSFRQSSTMGKNDEDEVKRHSIAVDEAKYVRDNLRRVFESHSKTTSIHLNGMYSDDSSQPTFGEDGRRSKRVEFCKTEVHFAAESGRVNIVETDGKPPPTNNFRRRRRVNSGSSIGATYLEAINSGVPVTHFGDNEKKSTAINGPTQSHLSSSSSSNTLLSTSSSLASSNSIGNSDLNVRSEIKTSVVAQSSSSSSNVQQQADITRREMEDDQDETSIRGILKNKPVKPRPYHLGENIESSESLWGVRLRPVSNDFSSWRLSDNFDEKNDSIESSSKLNEDRDRITADQPSSNLGYSTTKVNLSTQPSNFSWNNKDQAKPLSPIIFNGTRKFSLQMISSTDDEEKEFGLSHEKDKITKFSIDMSSPVLSTSPSTLSTSDINNKLKSTSLIMRTIRSASQFDEALKKLDLNDRENVSRLLSKTDNSTASSTTSTSSSKAKSHSHSSSTKTSSSSSSATSTSALKLISQMNAITKSNSANSLFKDGNGGGGGVNTTHPNQFSYTKSIGDSNGVTSVPHTKHHGGDRKYSSSLDGDSILSSYNRGDYHDDAQIEHDWKYRSTAHRRTSLNQLEDCRTSTSSLFNQFDDDATDGQSLSSRRNNQMKPKPIAAPRMKKIGPSNDLNQQLCQLRRLYDAAEQESDDSGKEADEEVKHYLGKLVSQEEKTSELSGSWSRVKAKRTVMKQNVKEEDIKKLTNSGGAGGKEEKKNLEYKFKTGNSDMVHSNVMSIALHSPIAATPPKTVPVPIAKPRTLSPMKTVSKTIAPTSTSSSSSTATSSHQITQSSTQQRSNETTPKFSRKLNPNEKDGERDSLKLTSGQRKLREHELSYFGVNVPKSGSNSLQTTPTNTLKSSNKNQYTTNHATQSSITQNSFNHQLITNREQQQRAAAVASAKKWQLTNDKPDLLRHSPSTADYVPPQKSSQSPPKTIVIKPSSENHQSRQETHRKTSMPVDKSRDEPVYENLRKPSSIYNRKQDLQRDEDILNELSKAADQILSTVAGYTDDDSMSDTKKSSSSKQNTRLQTIEENKSIQKTMQSKAVQVSRSFGDSLRRRRSSRISSESSNENIPKSSSISSSQKSTGSTTRRLCSRSHVEPHLNGSVREHQPSTSVKESSRNGSVTSSTKSSSTRKRLTQSGSYRMSRASSRDTLNSHASSSEDLPNTVTEVPRRPRRIRPKEKSESQPSSVTQRTTESRHRSSSSRNTPLERSSGRRSHTHHKSDKIETSKSSKGPVTTATTNTAAAVADHHQHHHQPQSKIRVKSGVVTTTSSSSRRSSSRQPTDSVWK